MLVLGISIVENIHSFTCQRDIQEIWRFIKNQEDIIKDNNTSIFLVATKYHELEHLQASQNEIIMNILV